MRRLFPDSLFGRLMTALLAAIVVSALIVALLIARERHDLAFWRSEAADIVTMISETSSELAALPPEARAEAVAALREQPLTVVRRRVPGPPALPEDIAAVARTYQTRLQEEFGGRYRVIVTPARPDEANVIAIGTEPASGFRAGVRAGESAAGDAPEGEQARFAMRLGEPGAGPFIGRLLDVGVDLPDGGAVTFRTAVPRPAPPLSRRIFLELGALTLLLGAVLYVMARNITNPLSDLSRAADAMGRGARVAPLRERGARELREATRAFNAMQERLHRYLDSRTRVLAAMSHDLRTPLTRLRLRAEAIADARQRDRFVADLNEMDHMVGNALDLFRGLNDAEESREIDLGALLAELQAGFAELGATVGIVGEAHRPILLKPLAIKRCLTNLLSNAIKFGGRANIVVEDGRELVIRVRDEGPGIPDDALEQVFEPFFRLESSRNLDTGGAGLGLSIARDIAQAHRGSLALRNLTPHGLEAVLTLPRTVLESTHSS